MIHTYEKNEHLREYRLLKSFFSEDIYHILRSLDVIIAGGAITALFTNREVNDLDLYFRSWDDLEIFITYMMDIDLRKGEHDLSPKTMGYNEEKRVYRDFFILDNGKEVWESRAPKFKVLSQKVSKQEILEMEDKFASDCPFDLSDISESTWDGIEKLLESRKKKVSYVRNIGMTDKSIMFSDGSNPVMQCIAFSVFDNAGQIFDKFDYTINMGAFSFSDETWVFDSRFLKHAAQKVLVLNPATDYPIISMLRASKYEARGYTISRRETMKLGVAVASLKMESWEDAKKHLSGMYGTNVEELFDTKEPFSFEGLFDKLDNAGDIAISTIATITDKRKGQRRFNLEAKDIFNVFQRLRKNTDRLYFKEFWAVSSAVHFYMMQAHTEKHVFGLNSNSIDNPEMLDKIRIYFDLDAAQERYKLLCKNGVQGSWHVGEIEPGACLFKVIVEDPLILEYEGDGRVSVNREDKAPRNKVTIVELLDCDGDLS